MQCGTDAEPLSVGTPTVRAMSTNDDAPFADGMLVGLVRSAERFENGMLLALTTTAGVVLGTLVGREAFLDRLQDSGIEDSTYQNLRSLWALPVTPSAPGTDDGSEGQPVTGRYMHLVDVTVRGGGLGETTLPVLRLRTDTVSGWMFGGPDDR